MGREHCISGFIEINSSDYQEIKKRIDVYLFNLKEKFQGNNNDTFIKG